MIKQPYILLCCMLLLLLSSGQLLAQDRLDEIRQIFEQQARVQPGLNEPVELSVSDLDVQQFIRGLGSTHSLNLSVSPQITGEVFNNFSNATVSDVLLYLCKEYNLDVDVIGSIISFKRYVRPVEPVVAAVKRQPGVSYNDQNNFLSLDLKQDSLPDVVEAITSKSFNNVVLGPTVKDRKVSVYIQNRPFASALEKMAFANNLKLTITEDNFYLLEAAEAAPDRRGKTPGGIKPPRGGDRDLGIFEKTVVGDRITVSASGTPIAQILEEVSREMNKNYFLYDLPEEKTTLYVENATYDGFLDYLLSNTDYTYKRDDQVYLIGSRNNESLRTTELVRLENRTVETVLDAIPNELKKDVDIKEFLELNGLILSGSHPNIIQIKEFLKQIDQVVPVVMIEVMIVEVQKDLTLSTGMDVGFGPGANPGPTTGTVGSGGVDVQMNSNTVNDIIGTLNGFGLVNLGNVTPDFYMNIRAMETNGLLKTRSTPKLATINGHNANLTIGSTKFYALQNVTTIPSANTTSFQNATRFEQNQADMTINITPLVSGDEQVTLTISVSQSTFGPPSQPEAPNDIFTQNFESVIRVKNNDMVILGGLESKSKDRSTSGLPLLGRIPILKYFFSSKSDVDSATKLNIFIKPTVIY